MKELGMDPAAELFEEKDFYLEEFRGRSVLIAVSPAVAAPRPDLRPLATAVADLVRNDTRVLLWWPASTRASERRLVAALGRTRALVRRRGIARRPPPVVRAAVTDHEPLHAALWSRLREVRLCVLLMEGETSFPVHAVELAMALRVPKVLLVDAQGGLRSGAERLSFVDDTVLETLLRQGEAEWSGLGDRRELLVAVRGALGGGVESVNLCTPDGIAEELFTYGGSGTLFTPGDYCQVAPLALDDYAQAERLLERGQREGLLKPRTTEQIAEILAAGFGATICGRHLAGVAGLVTAPYAAERAGEIVGLYTITRFKGEGIGERLVRRLLLEAESRQLAYAFACTVDTRAQQFFERIGFARVAPDAVPDAKWEGYDVRRRARIVVFRREVPGGPSPRP